MPGSIGHQTTSYRQGLVLGLTMAEIMLLLVFSLLIAIGVSLAAERVKRAGVAEQLHTAEAATAKANAVIDQIKRNPRLSEFLSHSAKAPVSAAKVDEFWRTLVESDDIVEAMERRGVSRTALRESSDYFAKMAQLKNRFRSRQGGAERRAGGGDRRRRAEGDHRRQDAGRDRGADREGRRRAGRTQRGRAEGRPYLAADHQSERGRRLLLRDPQRRAAARVRSRGCGPRWSKSCSRSPRRSRST